MTAHKNTLYIQVAATAIAAFVLYRIAQSIASGLSVITDPVDAFAKTTGSALSDISSAVNGYVPVGFSAASFYLDEKYIDADYTINRDWKAIMENTHDDIASLFNEITDNKGRLKLQYQHLINGEVSLTTIKG